MSLLDHTREAPGVVRDLLVMVQGLSGQRGYIYGGVSLRGLDCSAWASVCAGVLCGKLTLPGVGSRWTTAQLKASSVCLPYPTDDAGLGPKRLGLVLYSGHVGVVVPIRSGGVAVCDSGGKGGPPAGGPRLVSAGNHGTAPVGWVPLTLAKGGSSRVQELAAFAAGSARPSWLPSSITR